MDQREGEDMKIFTDEEVTKIVNSSSFEEMWVINNNVE